MQHLTDETHDPTLESWIDSANAPHTDYPIQNLPLCAFTPRACADEQAAPIHVGVPIGDRVLSLTMCHLAGLTADWEQAHDIDGFIAFNSADLSGLAEIPTTARRELRAMISGWLRTGSPDRDRLEPLVYAMADSIIHEPFSVIPNYTDFYASVFHATNVGSMFRPENPLLPNYKHIPVAYHGRASSVVPSGTPVRRPFGQQAPADEGEPPAFGPCRLLDYELEVGVVIARGNELGHPIPIDEAEDHILGLCLVNDWSARDIQKWEYQPLGPFLAKNFATTMGQVIVTMEALAPFRTPAFARPSGDPEPLKYLDCAHNRDHGGIDITLEVYLASKEMRDRGMDAIRLSRGSFRDMYWTVAQMVAHHSVNGCNLQTGDLLASGTVSGPARESRGCLLELTWDGDPWGDPPSVVPGTQRTPIELPTGETRRFLEDGDEVIIRGYCEREGYRRIGFGECRGVVLPARAH